MTSASSRVRVQKSCRAAAYDTVPRRAIYAAATSRRARSATTGWRRVEAEGVPQPRLTSDGDGHGPAVAPPLDPAEVEAAAGEHGAQSAGKGGTALRAGQAPAA